MGACVHQKFIFFDTFFALFSANSGESDVFGGVMILSVVLASVVAKRRENSGVPKITFFVFFTRFFVIFLVAF